MSLEMQVNLQLGNGDRSGLIVIHTFALVPVGASHTADFINLCYGSISPFARNESVRRFYKWHNIWNLLSSM
jgi:hypothetical protein